MYEYSTAKSTNTYKIKGESERVNLTKVHLCMYENITMKPSVQLIYINKFLKDRNLFKHSISQDSWKY
jgi:hypothetical protein